VTYPNPRVMKSKPITKIRYVMTGLPETGAVEGSRLLSVLCAEELELLANEELVGRTVEVVWVAAVVG